MIQYKAETKKKETRQRNFDTENIRSISNTVHRIWTLGKNGKIMIGGAEISSFWDHFFKNQKQPFWRNTDTRYNFVIGSLIYFTLRYKFKNEITMPKSNIRTLLINHYTD